MASTASLHNNAYRDIFEQFVDEASFLWLLRSIALKQPHYLPEDIAEIEQRIDNNLEGLLISSDEVWSICENALDLEEPGEVFTSAVVALQSLDAKKFQQVVDVALKAPDTIKALCSALAWVPPEISAPWIRKFQRGKDLDHKYLGFTSASMLRQDPGDYLNTIIQRDDCVEHEALFCRCLRLVGELKRHDLRQVLTKAKSDAREPVRFWSIWSLSLLGERSTLTELKAFVLSPGELQAKALSLYFRVAPASDAKSTISDLSKSPENARAAIRASAILGDPQVVPWLISKMEQPELARLAGEAFTQISGIQLAENDLDIQIPQIAELPNDDPDDQQVALDEDENLPWPNVDKLKATWQHYGTQFQVGSRYFLGRKIAPELLRDQVNLGYQRHRCEAALELALREASEPLTNIFGRQ